MVLVALHQTANTRVSLPAAAIDFIATIVLVFLVCFEHIRSIRPSFLACTFLLLTVLLDGARMRSIWLQMPSNVFTAVFTVSFSIRILLLCLESFEKRRLLLLSEKLPSAESTGGLFNRALFYWLFGLLKTGYNVLLTPSILPAVHDKLTPDELVKKLHDHWELSMSQIHRISNMANHFAADNKHKHTLLLIALKSLSREILGIAVPRLCLIGLSIAQPFMIGQTVAFLVDKEKSKNTGYGLIGAFSVVFISVAVC